MKRNIVLILILSSITAMSLSGVNINVAKAEAPESNSMKITYDSKGKGGGSDIQYDVSYNDSNGGKICVISFSEDGHSYEMTLSGLTEEFTDDQISELIDAFLSESPATIESNDIIDAEKFSDYMYGDIGNWVYSVDFRQDDGWGDNGMCWAASTSDMLWMTGWAELANKNNPDLKLENVDDLFTYFCSNFPNGTGFDAYDAIDWFMDGGYAGLSPDKMPGNLPDYSTADYAQSVSISAGDNIEDGIELIKAIKDGSIVGLAVDFSSGYYTLKDDSSVDITYDSDKKAYVESRYDDVDSSDKKIEADSFYVYDDAGTLTKVEKQDEDTYVTADGTEYDVFNVLKGDLYPIDNGGYALISDGSIFYNVVHDEKDIVLDSENSTISTGAGAHAITVYGYVLDTDEDQPENSIKALFIADSDNDA